MTVKTVTWVSEMGEPTDRGVRYINVAFSDKDTGFIGKKDLDDALEVRGLLQEAQGKELDFTLEDSGKKNKNDRTKWKIKAFGEYQPAPFQGGGGGASVNTQKPRGSRSPELEAFIQERMDRRTALMQAVEVYTARDAVYHGVTDIQAAADDFYDWLRSTAGSFPPFHPAAAGGEAADSGPPSTSPSLPATTSPEATEYTTKPKGLGTSADGTTSGASSAATVVGAADQGGQSGDGEAPGCPPHDPDMTVEPKGIGRRPCRKCGAWVR